MSRVGCPAMLLTGGGVRLVRENAKQGRSAMAEIPRVPVQEARRKIGEGRALLVCGYEDEAKCRSMLLEGASTFAGLESRLASLPKDREIIFYCG